MNKTKHMITGFAIFVAILMLMTISTINIEAAEDVKQTPTESEPTGDGYCLALHTAYRAVIRSLDDPSWTDYEIEILEMARDAILDEAEAAGCKWIALSLETDMQSSSVPLSQTIIPVTGPIGESNPIGPLQTGSPSQSTCSLCAAS